MAGVCSKFGTMRLLALLLLIAPMAWAQERPLEVDPNTKIQGGADVPASAGTAGAGARTDNRRSPSRASSSAAKSRPRSRAHRSGKPISARKPQEPRPEDDVAKGETAKPLR